MDTEPQSTRPSFENTPELPEAKAAGPSLLKVVVVLAALAVAGYFAFGQTGWLPGSGAGAGGGTAVAWGHDVPDAFSASAAQNKPVLLFFTADWCPPCRRLKSGPLSDDAIADHIESNFVPVKVDLTSPGEAENLAASDFGVQGIPVLIVADANGNEVARTHGGNASQLAGFLNRYTGSPVAAAR